MIIRIKRNGSEAAYMRLKRLGGDEFEIEFAEVKSEFRRQGMLAEMMGRAKQRCGALVAIAEPDAPMTRAEMEDWLQRQAFKFIRYQFRFGQKSTRVLYWSRD